MDAGSVIRSLSSREWATLTLLALFAIAILVSLQKQKKLHSSLAPLLHSLCTTAVFAPLILLTAWVVLATYAAWRMHFWNTGLVKDSIVWLTASTFASMFAALQAAKEDGFFRKSLLGAVGTMAIVQFVMNLYSFSYFVEVVLQLSLAAVGVGRVMAARDSRTAHLAQRLDAVSAFVGLALMMATARGLWLNWDDIATTQTVKAMIYSAWLPIVVLPFVWALGLYMSYETVAQRMREPIFGLNAPLRTRLALIVVLGPRLRAVNDLVSHRKDLRAISECRTFHDTREAVRVYLRRRDRQRLKPYLEDQRLARFAGVIGRGSDGRHLDQREIPETRNALTWIATCHMGHHRNQGRYRSDLLELLGDLKELGLDHGVQMHVASDGAAWYAWRRTPCGLVLGIGASAPPNDQWLYADVAPPAGPPQSATGWEQWLSSDPDWKG